MKDRSLLTVRDLSVTFYPGDSNRRFHPVQKVYFDVGAGEILGLVGESGCGKSLSALSIPNLLPDGAHANGQIHVQSDEYEAGSESLNNLRGRRIGYISQEPQSALNPVFSVGYHLRETLKQLRDLNERDRYEESVELLERVQLDRPEKRLEQYPHELSGGQRQRVVIALALAGDPDLLIADEPTTALDVTIESKIMDLFEALKKNGLGILLITHDLPLVTTVADRISVMYSGYTVETTTAQNIADSAQHPYSKGLMASSAELAQGGVDRLTVIPGEVPDPKNRPSGCPFHPRCSEKEPRCEEEFPDRFQPISRNETACWAREST